MPLTLILEPEMIEGQIQLIRRVMRLPRLTAKEKYHLSELLKVLYAFQKELQ